MDTVVETNLAPVTDEGLSMREATLLEMLVNGDTVLAGLGATRPGPWAARCGCEHWFESGYATPGQCPDCLVAVERWDYVDRKAQ